MEFIAFSYFVSSASESARPVEARCGARSAWSAAGTAALDRTPTPLLAQSVDGNGGRAPRRAASLAAAATHAGRAPLRPWRHPHLWIADSNDESACADGDAALGKQFIQGSGLLFAGAAAHGGADGLGGDVMRRAMQSPGQDGAFGELRRAPRQGHKRALRHILGQVRVANHAPRGGIDEVNVPPHQFSKRGLRPAFGVLAQKLLVGQIVHSWKSSRHRQNRTRKDLSSFSSA